MTDGFSVLKGLVILPGLNFNNLLGLTSQYEKEPGIPAGLNFNNTFTHIFNNLLPVLPIAVKYRYFTYSSLLNLL